MSVPVASAVFISTVTGETFLGVEPITSTREVVKSEIRGYAKKLLLDIHCICEPLNGNQYAQSNVVTLVLFYLCCGLCAFFSMQYILLNRIKMVRKTVFAMNRQIVYIISKPIIQKNIKHERKVLQNGFERYKIAISLSKRVETSSK